MYKIATGHWVKVLGPTIWSHRNAHWLEIWCSSYSLNSYWLAFLLWDFLVDPMQVICECLPVSVLLVCAGIRPFLLCCNCDSIIPFCGPNITLLSLPLWFVFNFSTIHLCNGAFSTSRCSPNIWFSLTNLVELSFREFWTTDKSMPCVFFHLSVSKLG